MKDNNRIMENQELLDYVGGYINAFEVGFPIYKNRLAEKLQKDFGIGKKDSTVIATVAFDKIMDTGKISNLRLYRKGIYYRTESTPFGELGINKEQLIADKYLVPDIGYETGFTVAAKVVSEQKTVSPAFTPASFIARWSAAVPAERARQ